MYLGSTRQSHAIFALKLRRILLQVLLYLLNLLRGEQSRRSRSPQQLVERGQVDSFQNTALECPYPVTIVNAGLPAGHCRDNVPEVNHEEKVNFFL